MIDLRDSGDQMPKEVMPQVLRLPLHNAPSQQNGMIIGIYRSCHKDRKVEDLLHSGSVDCEKIPAMAKALCAYLGQMNNL